MVYTIQDVNSLKALSWQGTPIILLGFVLKLIKLTGVGQLLSSILCVKKWFLTLCRPEPPKMVLWHTSKTH